MSENVLSKNELKNMIKEAKERLDSAEILLKAHQYSDSISRSYYAILDIARIALIIKKIYPKSHSGTLSKFSYAYIEKGFVDKKYNKIIRQIEKDRLDADYRFSKKFSESDAREKFEQAKEFVEDVEKVINR